MVEQKWVPHIWKEGSRDHVLSYHSNGTTCSVKSCEVNKPTSNFEKKMGKYWRYA